MAWKKVKKYSLGYSLKTKQFYIYYTLKGDNKTTQIFPSPEEFLGLSDMFRNGGSISYNTVGRYFVTSSEEISEEEPLKKKTATKKKTSKKSSTKKKSSKRKVAKKTPRKKTR